MKEFAPLIISLIALLLSGITTWFTLFHRGKIKISHPSVIFFGPDGGYGAPKVFLRGILFSTSKRGKIIESMYVKLKHKSTVQIFNIWVYGETNDLKRGSGLYVSNEGIVYNHHFALPKDDTEFSWKAGSYTIELYSKVVSQNKPTLIYSQDVTLPEDYAKQLSGTNSGVYFDWEPESQIYNLHLDTRYLPKSEAEVNYEL